MAMTTAPTGNSAITAMPGKAECSAPGASPIASPKPATQRQRQSAASRPPHTAATSNVAERRIGHHHGQVRRDGGLDGEEDQASGHACQAECTPQQQSQVEQQQAVQRPHAMRASHCARAQSLSKNMSPRSNRVPAVFPSARASAAV
ncbi:hypothetical protein [Pseudoxanthomonas yeongjuensis]|uniref:hypothetical protein n=1 Tax=Pseudoxanthomonas yeongjuensis TaxID=377616 RepID=UPI001B87BFAA|nr:hypothetical protein [Pseudoxanthomonas yeongjuensis]